MARFHLNVDLLAGALFLLVGVGVFLVAGDYPVGAAERMGPGYFPRLLGLALIGLGVVVMLLAPRGEAGCVTGRLPLIWFAVPLFWVLLAGLGRTGLTGLDGALAALLLLAWPATRPLFWVLAGVALFALLLDEFGLALATLGLMLAARRAEPELSWRGTFVTWLVLLAVCLTIFVWGLGTPLPVWPRFLVA